MFYVQPDTCLEQFKRGLERAAAGTNPRSSEQGSRSGLRWTPQCWNSREVQSWDFLLKNSNTLWVHSFPQFCICALGCSHAPFTVCEVWQAGLCRALLSMTHLGTAEPDCKAAGRAKSKHKSLWAGDVLDGCRRHWNNSPFLLFDCYRNKRDLWMELALWQRNRDQGMSRRGEGTGQAWEDGKGTEEQRTRGCELYLQPNLWEFCHESRAELFFQVWAALSDKQNSHEELRTGAASFQDEPRSCKSWVPEFVCSSQASLPASPRVAFHSH